MTNKEITEALRCCTGYKCNNCPYDRKDRNILDMQCVASMAKDALDLINRQKAEIERLIDLASELTEDNEAWLADNIDLRVELKTAKAEAIKEFAEMLKNSMVIKLDRKFYFPIIDNLVKEMTEEQQ